MAIMPFAGVQPRLPEATSYSLKHIFLAYSDTDPAMAPGYDQLIGALGVAWAKAIGLSEADQTGANSVALDDRVMEGSGYTGSDPVVLATRDSRAQQTTFRSASSGAAVRVVEFDRAGHFWPLPEPSDWPDILSAYGLRNQDLDMSEAIWDFFNDGP